VVGFTVGLAVVGLAVVGFAVVGLAVVVLLNKSLMTWRMGFLVGF
jgi:hypothetical protein